VLITSPNPKRLFKTNMLSDSLALSLATKSAELTVEEHTEVFTVAYEAAFATSLIKNLTKAKSTACAYPNYALAAPRDAKLGAMAALAAAIKLKAANKSIKSIVSAKKAACIALRAKKLVTEKLQDQFELLHMLASLPPP